MQRFMVKDKKWESSKKKVRVYFIKEQENLMISILMPIKLALTMKKGNIICLNNIKGKWYMPEETVDPFTKREVVGVVLNKRKRNYPHRDGHIEVVTEIELKFKDSEFTQYFITDLSNYDDLVPGGDVLGYTIAEIPWSDATWQDAVNKCVQPFLYISMTKYKTRN